MTSTKDIACSCVLILDTKDNVAWYCGLDFAERSEVRKGLEPIEVAR